MRSTARMSVTGLFMAHTCVTAFRYGLARICRVLVDILPARKGGLRVCFVQLAVRGKCIKTAAAKIGQLINANIPEYSHGNRLNHEPKRPRKLLLSTREINKLFGAVERKGMTLVPMSIYFNKTGRAKVELALGKGRKAQDKRDYIKDRDWKRDKARLMREKG